MRRIPSHNFARLHQRFSSDMVRRPGGFSENKTCIRFKCSVSRHSNRKIMQCFGTLENVLRTIFPMKCCFPMRHPFTREGIFNTHNDHIWAVENPHANDVVAQIRFSVNVWAGIMGDHHRTFLFPCRLTGLNYLRVLPPLRDEQISLQQTMWFQHDGAPAHFSETFVIPDVTFGQQDRTWWSRVICSVTRPIIS
ncbi:uncharacterized protein TNCV_2590511 [Trichonephila clavipes]|nr:uncharacterized protein TNCV_2590511 [Trichonephila clavipes]